MKEVKFTCPECKSHFLEEVQINTITTSSLKNIAIENGVVNCEYDLRSIEDGETERYQCGECGCFLKINEDVVNDLEGLALWFKKHEASE